MATKYKIGFFFLLFFLSCFVFAAAVMTTNVMQELKLAFFNKKFCSDNQTKCEPTLRVGVGNLPTQLTSSFQLPVAKLSLNLTALVASDPSGVSFPPQGPWKKIVALSAFEGDPPICWVLQTTDWFFVVFRGTKTAQDVKADLDYKQTSLTSKKSQIRLRRSATESGGLPVHVHEGFWKTYQSVRPDLEAVLKRNTKTVSQPKVVFCGHSLGSAVATLAMYDLCAAGKLNTVKNQQVAGYVFASPRVGDENFRSDFQNQNLFLINTINTSDIVPTLPPSVMPINTKETEYFTHVGQILSFETNWHSFANNHECPVYLDFLNKTNNNNR